MCVLCECVCAERRKHTHASARGTTDDSRDTAKSTADGLVRFTLYNGVNPFPTLLGHAPVGCAEAPEIVSEGPGYRC